MDRTDKDNEIFDEIIGQEYAISILKSAIKKERIAPAYLFHGPEGVGRKKTALCFLEGLLNHGNSSARDRKRLRAFNHPDLYWVEPTYTYQGELITRSFAEEEGITKRNQPQIRLEQIRRIANFLGKQPIEGKASMVVIEDIELMQEAAANALLKTLEEPKQGVIILISSRPEKLLETIISRCQNIPFTRLKLESIQTILNKEARSFQILTSKSLTEEERSLLHLANGSPGSLLKNLNNWNEIPSELFSRLSNIPQNPLEALYLARDITDSLDEEKQLWLINWLAQKVWRETYNKNYILQLEKLRSQLLCYVQPRLGWEVTLIRLLDMKN